MRYRQKDAPHPFGARSGETVTGKETYNASSIKALSSHDHLLKRLSLTFGPVESSNETFARQKNVAIREIVDNAVDEVRGGYGSKIRLKFFKDRSFEVQDSGRGIPVDIGHDSAGNRASGIYLALGVIQSGGKFSTDSKRFSTGLNGVGASSTIHVSRRSDITVFRNKKIYKLSFKDGTPGFFDTDDDPDSNFTPLKDLTKLHEEPDRRPTSEKKLYPTGTIVKCWLRDEVFSSQYQYDDEDIVERLKGTAFLVPELEAEVYSELSPIENPQTGTKEPLHEFFHYPDGISALVDSIQIDKPLTETVLISAEGYYTEKNVPVIHEDGQIRPQNVDRDVPIEIAFRYGDGFDYNMSSFVNTINTKLGGVHETALEHAMVSTFNEKFRSMRGLLSKNDDLPIFDDFKEGLTIVLSVQISEPSFTSQSKEALSGSEVQKAIQETLKEAFSNWIKSSKNSDTVQTIARKVVTAAKNRQKAREQRDLNRKKNRISSASLPTKLLDCELSGTEAGELYICEGDSAIGSLKQARDGRINALLAIRGKIINAHKQPMKRVLDNTEVQDIIKSLGAGAGSDFDIDRMRYGRIFIAVDADPDGNAIACLIYALFWHLFRPVIEKGMLYKVETPLFSIATQEGRKSRKIYARDEQERDNAVADLERQKIKFDVSRLKGLGEVEPDILEETAINPETRVITQITVPNTAEAEESLDLIFGEDTDSRKSWMSESDIDTEAVAS